MYEKSGKFYADWRDKSGKRLRKSFTSKRAALQFEAEQKELAHPKSKARGIRLPGSYSPHSSTTGNGRIAALPRPSSPLLAASRPTKSPRLTPKKSTTPSRVVAISAPRKLARPAIRAILRWLWGNHGAPKLDQHIRRYPGTRPRNITADREEIDRSGVQRAAQPALVDTPLFRPRHPFRHSRAPRARRIPPANRRAPLHQQARCAPHAARHRAVRELIDQCDLRDPRPFVRQLWPHRNGRQFQLTQIAADATPLRHAFQKLCKANGITRHIVPHDLRRTTAVAMLRHTHDVRDVQAILGHRSSIHNLVSRPRSAARHALNLETIKRPTSFRERNTA